MLFVDATLENKLTLDGSLVSSESLLSQEQSFEIMQESLHKNKSIFDENVQQVLEKVDMENTKLDSFYKEWLDIYNLFENKLEKKLQFCKHIMLQGFLGKSILKTMENV